MRRSTLLLLADETTTDDEFQGAAERAAAADDFLAVLLHRRMPTLPLNSYGALPYSPMHVPNDWPSQLDASSGALKERASEVEHILTAAGASGEVRTLWCSDSEIQRYVELSAKTSDLAFLTQSVRGDEELFRHMLHGVLFRSPIGVMLNAQPGFARKNILIAWDNSSAAARAVHLSLDMLIDADSVTIACFDPPALQDGDKYEPGAALATWLSRHDCSISVAQYPTGGAEVADVIADRAREAGADLVVMGAYGRSRMRQAILGGTTRTMIDQTDLPVFLAH
ncbi:MAG: universal stress protein [Pseudomonadota bacterium]